MKTVLNRLFNHEILSRKESKEIPNRRCTGRVHLLFGVILY